MDKMRFFLAAIITLASACIMSDETPSGEIKSKGDLALTLQPSASETDGVAGFKIEVYTGATLDETRYIALLSGHLPSGYVPDAGASHDYASTLFVLLPGNHHVKAYPMKSETVPSTLCEMAETDVLVTPGNTATISLVSQCVNAAHGGAEVIAALNNNPQILNLVFDPSQFVSTCQQTTATLTAEDPDGDALTYSWQVQGAPPGGSNTNSVSLNGTDQYLSAADSPSLSPTGSFTVEMWVRFDALPASDMAYYLASKYTAGVPDKSFNFLFYRTPSGDKYCLRGLITNDGSTLYQINGTNSVEWLGVEVDHWYHLAFRFDSVAHKLAIFIDGALHNETDDLGVSSVYDSTADFVIGALYSINPVGFTNGLIDDVRLWNVARTQSEISANMSTEIDSAPNLQASWHLNNVLNDSSGNSNTLTNNNGAVFSADVPFGGGTSYSGSGVGNVYSFTGYVAGTYNLQATACDPFNLCSSLTAPIHVIGNPCAP